MAFLPDKVIAARPDGYIFERFTQRTIADSETFKQAPSMVLHSGFATNDREDYDHFNGIAAPIVNCLGEPIAVPNVWTAPARFPMNALLVWADDLRATTDRVTAMIGGVEPKTEDLV